MSRDGAAKITELGEELWQVRDVVEHVRQIDQIKAAVLEGNAAVVTLSNCEFGTLIGCSAAHA